MMSLVIGYPTYVALYLVSFFLDPATQASKPYAISIGTYRTLNIGYHNIGKNPLSVQFNITLTIRTFLLPVCFPSYSCPPSIGRCVR